MTDLEIWVVVLAVPVVLGNAWVFWRKWRRRKQPETDWSKIRVGNVYLSDMSSEQRKKYEPFLTPEKRAEYRRLAELEDQDMEWVRAQWRKRTTDMADLYDSDFFTWTQQQAEAVRGGVWDDIDRDQLAEEIEDWWKRESRLLRHYLDDLMVWLVAYAYAPEQRDAHAHWYVRITGIRCEIEVIVDIWANLAARVDGMVPKAYAHARKVASEETGLSLATFPETCPWTPEQVLTAPLEGPNSPFGEPRW